MLGCLLPTSLSGMCGAGSGVLEATPVTDNAWCYVGGYLIAGLDCAIPALFMAPWGAEVVVPKMSGWDRSGRISAWLRLSAE